MNLEKKEILVTIRHFEKDLKIEISISETILKLKEKIQIQHENKPSPNCQKLIFAGKILSDTSELSQVLEKTPINNPTFHLVISKVVEINNNPFSQPIQDVNQQQQQQQQMQPQPQNRGQPRPLQQQQQQQNGINGEIRFRGNLFYILIFFMLFGSFTFESTLIEMTILLLIYLFKKGKLRVIRYILFGPRHPPMQPILAENVQLNNNNNNNNQQVNQSIFKTFFSEFYMFFYALIMSFWPNWEPDQNQV
eukprot:TRINITY_DN681_c0_g2_i2.p1 TRINITY_DN681_c0_g2~~TRINITY_DN681_c0_g2_i2.p1  ORF type:complete len:250 (+),score=98.83 TRINITY_DN681_c0_g2_i2:37-786(+)